MSFREIYDRLSVERIEAKIDDWMSSEWDGYNTLDNKEDFETRKEKHLLLLMDTKLAKNEAEYI